MAKRGTVSTQGLFLPKEALARLDDRDFITHFPDRFCAWSLGNMGNASDIFHFVDALGFEIFHLIGNKQGPTSFLSADFKNTYSGVLLKA